MGGCFCPLVVEGKKNPLAHLLGRPCLLQRLPRDRLEEVVELLHQDILDPYSISPLLMLLLGITETNNAAGFVLAGLGGTYEVSEHGLVCVLSWLKRSCRDRSHP